MNVMKSFYVFSLSLLALLVVPTASSAYELADFAGNYFIKAHHTNAAGTVDETSYINLTLTYGQLEEPEEGEEAKTGLYLTSLTFGGNTYDALHPCFLSGDSLTICQAVMKNEDDGGYYYYMGNNEEWGHMHFLVESTDKLLSLDGINMYANIDKDWTSYDIYQTIKGFKLYREGTTEDPDPDAQPETVDLTPYAGSFYFPAVDAEGNSVNLAFTLVADETGEKLTCTKFGYEGKEFDTETIVTYDAATQVFSIDYIFDMIGYSLMNNSYLEYKFDWTDKATVVTEFSTTDFMSFTTYTAAVGTAVRRAGTVEEPWESVALADMAGDWIIPAIYPEVTNSETNESVERPAYLKFTMTYDADAQTLTMTSIEGSRDAAANVISANFVTKKDTLYNDEAFYYMDPVTFYMLSDASMMAPLYFTFSTSESLTAVKGVMAYDFMAGAQYTSAAGTMAYRADSEQGKAIADEVAATIDTVRNDESQSMTVFDLYGRRVNRIEKGKMYIINNKKFIIR